MPGNTPTGLLPTVPPGGSTDTGEQSSPGQPPDSARAAAPAGMAGSSTAGSSMAGSSMAGSSTAGPSAAGPSAAGSSAAATPGAAAAPQATPAAQRRPGRRAWYRLISPLAVLVIWQLVSSSGLVSEQKLPSPTTVLHTAITLITTNSAAYGTLQGAMAVSLERVAIGFALGGAVGLVLAVVAGLSRLGENAVDPLHADAAHAAAVRADPGVHRLVRHRRAAQGAADRAGRRRSRCTSTRSPASAAWTPSWPRPARCSG